MAKKESKKKTRKVYSDDFKARVVARVQSGEAAYGVAKDIGISNSVVHNWIRAAKEVGGQSKPKSAPESAPEMSTALVVQSPMEKRDLARQATEIGRLTCELDCAQRRIVELTEERAVLHKAALPFARGL